MTMSMILVKEVTYVEEVPPSLLFVHTMPSAVPTLDQVAAEVMWTDSLTDAGTIDLVRRSTRTIRTALYLMDESPEESAYIRAWAGMQGESEDLLDLSEISELCWGDGTELFRQLSENLSDNFSSVDVQEVLRLRPFGGDQPPWELTFRVCHRHRAEVELYPISRSSLAELWQGEDKTEES